MVLEYRSCGSHFPDGKSVGVTLLDIFGRRDSNGNAAVAVVALTLTILIGKLIYLAINGVLFEDDSVGYLTFHAGLYHPPGYGAFTSAIYSLFGSLHAVIVVQALMFSFSAGLLIHRFISSGQMRLLAAVVIAIDPISGILACSILSECAFISFGMLLFYFAFSIRKVADKWHWVLAILIGIIAGNSYLIRYAGSAYLLLLPLFLLLAGYSIRKVAVLSILAIVAFQMVLLPLRIYYTSEFGTPTINAFSGMSSWNRAAHLYPGSSVAESPATEFENFLGQISADQFSIEKSFETAHIYSAPAPFPAYIIEKELNSGDVIRLSEEVGDLGWRLVMESPGKQLTEFVFPNMVRPFHLHETPTRENAAEYISAEFDYENQKEISWQPYQWIVLFILILITGCIQFFIRKFLRPEHRTILLFVLIYLIALVFLVPIYPRFVLILSPLILINLIAVVEIGVKPGAKLVRK